MKRTFAVVLLSLLFHNITPVFAGEIWQLVPARTAPGAKPAMATGALTYHADEQSLRLLLSAAKNAGGRIIELPMPDGSMRSFRVMPASVLPPALAEKYPDISTYTAYAVGNEHITAKLDFTLYGFHAMVYDGGQTSLINPVDDSREGYYTVYYKKDEVRTSGRGCTTIESGSGERAEREAQALRTSAGAQQKVVNGYYLRRFRLALSCTHQYAQAATGTAAPTKAQVLSKMTTTMNRVNGIYEREMSTTMVFADKEDTLIFPVEAGDPFGPSNFNITSLLNLNQTFCDSLIGDANYDIGHIFSTSGDGGLSQLGVICQTGSKAQSVTGREDPTGDGFDVDYVSHEMGHQYGADHTFNNSQLGGCNGNAVMAHAYEPGSGSTIMAYAGLCSPDNLQAHSDAYFHATSLQQIQHYMVTGGDACAVKIPTGNKQPGIGPFSASYKIPYRTPFELTAPTAADSTGDSLIYYCWEQWDLGDFGKTLTNTSVAGPLFRSYAPVLSPVRTFPNLIMLRNGVLSNAGVDNASGEKIPDVARSLKFKLAARSLHNGFGCIALPDDSIHLDVINTGGQGFTVTSQNTNGITYNGNSTQTVNWDVASTNGAPINATNVDIYLSADSGYSWPYHLGTFPNSGTATVTIPNPDATIDKARIKVKGENNVFFNINSRDFKILRNFESSIQIYPVPAHTTLHIIADKTGVLHAAVFDVVGRLEWQGDINNSVDLPVHLWARGMYIVKLIDPIGRKIIRKVVVN